MLSTTVPTPVNRMNSDLSIVESAMRSVLESMADGRNQIIVVESTVFPGATRRIARSIEAEMSHDFPKHVKFAYSPERVSPERRARAQRISRKLLVLTMKSRVCSLLIFTAKSRRKVANTSALSRLLRLRR